MLADGLLFRAREPRGRGEVGSNERLWVLLYLYCYLFCTRLMMYHVLSTSAPAVLQSDFCIRHFFSSAHATTS